MRKQTPGWGRSTGPCRLQTLKLKAASAHWLAALQKIADKEVVLLVFFFKQNYFKEDWLQNSLMLFMGWKEKGQLSALRPSGATRTALWGPKWTQDSPDPTWGSTFPQL